MKYLLFLLFSITSARAQFLELGVISGADPFEPVEIASHMLNADDLVRIIGDTVERATLDRGVLLYGDSETECRLAVHRYGSWVDFELPFRRATVEYRFEDIDGGGGEELLVTGSISFNGSGGGTTIHGMAIYRIETSVIRLMGAVDGLFDEAFSRPYNQGDALLRECRRNISVERRLVRVSAVESTGSGEGCEDLTDIQPGRYEIRDGAFVRAGK